MSTPRKLKVSGSVTAIGTICSFDISAFRHFSTVVGGTFVGTVQTQVSLDGGTTWVLFGTAVTAPAAVAYSNTAAVLVRLQCTAYTSGTIVGGMVAMT